MVILKTLISLNLIINLTNLAVNNKVIVPSPKVITSAFTNIPVKDNWVTVPEGTKEITIFVEAQNTETVLFWLIPTGTETWWERKLIGYDINEDKSKKFDETQKYSLTWKIDEPFLHHHLVVEVVGMNRVTSGGNININTESIE
ncbi:hypothetical protein IMZ08_02650 [Bacillus luteolus]|uniref:Uncharacterized protein n=1 Tax=Litchfieldia luteola TaxID=682179 RepID=A0ABR9QEM9_9BACI|nr:hypothetical protein [Cytobacillus luteolus]MBE4906956.1 hypothetical protein [Cytobacillus luteolus]MBP1943579.1 hypothetical protein [Cytobacillus luteolus]